MLTSDGVLWRLMELHMCMLVCLCVCVCLYQLGDAPAVAAAQVLAIDPSSCSSRLSMETVGVGIR